MNLLPGEVLSDWRLIYAHTQWEKKKEDNLILIFQFEFMCPAEKKKKARLFH